MWWKQPWLDAGLIHQGLQIQTGCSGFFTQEKKKKNHLYPKKEKRAPISNQIPESNSWKTINTNKGEAGKTFNIHVDIKLSDRGCRSWDITMVLYSTKWSHSDSSVLLVPKLHKIWLMWALKTKACGCEEKTEYQKKLTSVTCMWYCTRFIVVMTELLTTEWIV